MMCKLPLDRYKHFNYLFLKQNVKSPITSVKFYHVYNSWFCYWRIKKNVTNSSLDYGKKHILDGTHTVTFERLAYDLIQHFF